MLHMNIIKLTEIQVILVIIETVNWYKFLF